MLLRVALWDCLLTDWPYHAPAADTHPDNNEYDPCGEPLATFDALGPALRELLDAMHGPGAAACDLKPAVAYFQTMAPYLSRTTPTRYFTPYTVTAPGQARAWCVGLCISREPLTA